MSGGHQVCIGLTTTTTTWHLQSSATNLACTELTAVFINPIASIKANLLAFYNSYLLEQSSSGCWASTLLVSLGGQI